MSCGTADMCASPITIVLKTPSTVISQIAEQEYSVVTRKCIASEVTGQVKWFNVRNV